MIMAYSVLTFLNNNQYLVALLLVLPLLYLYLTRNHDFWKKLGVKGPTPLPFFGNGLDGIMYSSPVVEMYRYKKYGRFYGYYDGNTPQLLVADPDLIKSIAVKDWHLFINRSPQPSFDPIITKSLIGLKDERWKSVRSMMSPAFTSSKIRRMMPLMKECVTGVMNALEKANANGTDLDLKFLFGAYTTEVIASCAFATQVDAHNNSNDPFVKNGQDIFNFSIPRILAVTAIPRDLRRLLDIDYLLKNPKVFFRHVSQHLLNSRKASPEKRDDLLQILVSAEKSSQNLKDQIRDINEGSFSNEQQDDIDNYAEQMSVLMKPGAELTDDEAIAEMFLFFIAGYETTSSVLTYCAYVLAQHPSVQEKLHREITAALQGEPGLTYEQINKLEYLNAVVCETLRLYSPVLKLDRETREDYLLGETGVVLPKGTAVQLGFYAVHHDEEFWPEPFAFKPERFFKENAQHIKPYTYLPFGAGPRNCIGMRFALTEVKLLLCTILTKFKFVPTQRTEQQLKFTFHPVILQAKDVIVGVEKR